MDGPQSTVLGSHSHLTSHTPCTGVCGTNATLDTSGYAVAEVKVSPVPVYPGAAWWAMVIVAFALLTLCALLAGLTLAICGLELAYLNMRSVSGTKKERRQALVVGRMKRRSTWMLCSLIICSVACSEYFPFVIQGLCHADDEWVAVIISTLLLAVFAELIPQWLIPRNAIAWGYYCWPLIWGCMWLTATVSYPLSWFLDNLTRTDGFGIFTNDQLATIIRYHEKIERHGGMLDADTSRILLGALDIGGRKVGRDPGISTPGSPQSDEDVEKKDTAFRKGLIVNWAVVKYVGLDDVVDLTFFQKITSWSYSRIPVIEEYCINNGHKDTPATSGKEDKRVFGYIHIRDLIGILSQLQAKPGLSRSLLVRDLPIYPLPIVEEDMPVLQLLSMFQLGMSRMALVIPMKSPLSPEPGYTSAQAAKEDVRMVSQSDDIDVNTNWPADYLSDAQAGLECQKTSRRCRGGVGAPKPIGIITFHDIVDAVFQKTSYDEKLAFGWHPDASHGKRGNACTQTSVSSIRSTTGLDSCMLPNTEQRPYRGSIQIRKMSKVCTVGGVDGADDRSLDGLDTILYGPTSRCSKDGSSYTQNSQGGFHHCNSSNSFDNENLREFKDLASLGLAISLSPHDFLTLPAKIASLSIFPREHNPSREMRRPTDPWRHFSDGGKLPYMHLTPISTQFEHPSNAGKQKGQHNFPSPSPLEKQGPNSDFGPITTGNPTTNERDATDDARFNGSLARSCIGNIVMVPASFSYDNYLGHVKGTVRASDAEATLIPTDHLHTAHSARNMQEESWGGAPDIQSGFGGNNFAIAVEQPHNRFPLQLLENNMPNRQRPYASMATHHRLNSSNCEIFSREEGFHDDRALLPSQKQMIDKHANYRVVRITSLWF